jgi:hypothetical protein
MASVDGNTAVKASNTVTDNGVDASATTAPTTSNVVATAGNSAADNNEEGKNTHTAQQLAAQAAENKKLGHDSVINIT